MKEYDNCNDTTNCEMENVARPIMTLQRVYLSLEKITTLDVPLLYAHIKA
jgi:hypothetical protein